MSSISSLKFQVIWAFFKLLVPIDNTPEAVTKFCSV